MRSVTFSFLIIACLQSGVMTAQMNKFEKDACARFKSEGQDRYEKYGPIFYTASKVTSISEAKAWASYYRNLKWRLDTKANLTTDKNNRQQINYDYTLTLEGKNQQKPTEIRSKELLLPQVNATAKIYKQFLPYSYTLSLGKCGRIGSGGQTTGVVPISKKDYPTFVRQQNAKFLQWAERCEEAASAGEDMRNRLAGISRSMVVFCGNNISPTNVKKRKDNVDPPVLVLNNENNKKQNNRNNPKNQNSNMNKGGTTKKIPLYRKIGYKKAKSSIKTSKFTRNGRFIPIPRLDSQRDEVYRFQRNMQNQWNTFSRTDRQIATLFNNLFWKNQKQKEIERKKYMSKQVSRARAFHRKRFNNYIQNWEDYANEISGWMATYANYIPEKWIPKLQKDLSIAKKNIEDMTKVKYQFLADTKKDEDDFAVDGEASNAWYRFNNGSYDRNFKDARYSLLSSLASFVEKNPTSAHKVMLADYAYLGYKRAKKMKGPSISFALEITKYFNDFPEIATMNKEVEAYRKTVDANRKKQKIIRSYKRYPQVLKTGDYDGLNRLIDSLIQFGDKKEFSLVFYSSSSYKLVQDYGYYDLYVKLLKWLSPYHNLSNSFYDYYTGISSYVSGIQSYSYGGNQMYYYGDVTNSNHGVYALQALTGPKQFKTQNIETTFKYLESARRKSYKKLGYEVKIRWPQIVLCFLTENYEWLYDKKDPRLYHGIWITKKNPNELEIAKVDKNSPADHNGLQKGDKIVQVYGKNISDLLNDYELMSTFSNYSPHSTRLYLLGKKRPTVLHLVVKKTDGRLLEKSFPIVITKKNVRKKFKGTERVLN